MAAQVRLKPGFGSLGFILALVLPALALVAFPGHHVLVYSQYLTLVDEPLAYLAPGLAGLYGLEPVKVGVRGGAGLDIHHLRVFQARVQGHDGAVGLSSYSA
ncbi:MAG TPA: hypothetical protein DCG47_13720, partial [Spirochaetaceae bacterium]|nr:hypothetical protein [Spirochaetaceae bacterium]